ncbi:MAG: hypothetical protein WC390_10260 [Sulfurimonas sp.]|jgi:hypothetical protein
MYRYITYYAVSDFDQELRLGFPTWAYIKFDESSSFGVRYGGDTEEACVVNAKRQLEEFGDAWFEISEEFALFLASQSGPIYGKKAIELFEKYTRKGNSTEHNDWRDSAKKLQDDIFRDIFGK